MNPEYTQQEFDSAKSRSPLPLRCKQCSTIFKRPKSQIQKVTAGSGLLSLDFCSSECMGKAYDTTQETNCHKCNKLFYRTKKQINSSPHLFCSRSCSASWNNSHKKYGTRRSKLEKWLEPKLTSKYPLLKFDFNKTDSINAELDIYCVTLKLAFELNGIFHYEPIFGEDKLARTASNDKTKFQSCLKAGIELCIIDVSHMKYFKDHTAEPFLDIITNIIDQKLATYQPISKDGLGDSE